MRISDWSSDVCSSDLNGRRLAAEPPVLRVKRRVQSLRRERPVAIGDRDAEAHAAFDGRGQRPCLRIFAGRLRDQRRGKTCRRQIWRAAQPPPPRSHKIRNLTTPQATTTQDRTAEGWDRIRKKRK